MAKTVILKSLDENKREVHILPVTRGELVLDSSGNQAFHSNEFLATESQPGLTKINYVEVSTSNISTTPNESINVIQVKSSSDKVYPVTSADAVLVKRKYDVVTLSETLDDIATLYKDKSEVGHIHNTSEITALTSYTKATEPSDISTTDTLNSALGKVEYKADRAFSWITGVTSTDTDNYINKWDEIVDFLDGVEEDKEIADSFVSVGGEQTITGYKTFSPGFAIGNSSATTTTTVLNGTYENCMVSPINSIISINPGVGRGDTVGYKFSDTAMYPGTSGEYSLGTSDKLFEAVYATTFVGNATSANKVSNALTIINGDTTVTYDGSSSQTITIESSESGSSHCLTIGNLEDGSTDNIETGNEIFVYQNVDNLLAIDKTSLPTASTSQAGIIKIGTTSTTAMAGNKTLTNVSYTSTTTDSNYPLLFKYSTGTTTTAAGTRFNAGIYANPSTVTISATNGFYETSDERLKDFQGNIDVDLDKLALIPKKYFTWKDDSEKVLRIGTSAQELQKLYPELVSDIKGELTVDYAKLSIVALDAVDKLNTKVKSLEERLSKLESILSNLINS